MDIGKVFSALLYFIVGIVEVLLGFRFALLLFAANTEAEFSSWVLSSTEPLVAPFRGVFPTLNLAGTITVEIGTVLAMIVYAVFTVVAIQLIKAFEGFVLKPSGPKGGAIPNMPQQPQQGYQPPMQGYTNMPMQNTNQPMYPQNMQHGYPMQQPPQNYNQMPEQPNMPTQNQNNMPQAKKSEDEERGFPAE